MPENDCWENLGSALRDYLPFSLKRQCLLGDEILDPYPCAHHLDALLRAISTYLPRQVVVPLLADPVPGRIGGAFTDGTVMFADISGFTAMSERLSRLGKAGAEEITSIVNRFFAALLEVTGRYGGDLLKFGGDALLVFFGGERHALRACLAALRMQATMSRFSETATSQGVFRLRMAIGLGTGPLFMASLGGAADEYGGMEFAVMGRAMAQMARAEDRAEAGEIFVDSDTCSALADRGIVGEAENGFCRLEGIRGSAALEAEVATLTAPDPLSALPPPPTEDALPWIAETVQRIRALALFLPPGLMDKIRLEPERIAIGGEHRPVTVLFANFYGIDEIIEELGQTRSAEITAILNAHFTTMRQIIRKYGGVVNKVDSYAVGHRIMALFGAPRAHIDDPERAVRAALEMQEAMAGFGELQTSRGSFFLKQRVGVNTGLVFAGNVGSIARQEYSVMGDEVNLTARLMAVATEGQVLVSQSTARQAGDAFVFREQDPVRVKGKSSPVHNYEALGVREGRAHGRGVRARRPMIGRDEEWDVVHSLSDRALAGEVQVLTITGDVGLGKSHLLDEMISHWTKEHRSLSVSTACPSFGVHTPYLPWLDLLRTLFGFRPADSGQVKLEKVDALLHKVDPTWRDWSALIGSLLGLEVEESDLVRGLDARTRQQTIFRVVTGVLDYVAGEQPLLLAIDDVQWADDTSCELVNYLARRVSDRPLFLVLAHRPEESLTLDLADLPHHRTLGLRELSDQASLRLLDTLLPTTPQMPDHLKRLILDKARGNPLFIDAVAHSLIDNYLTLDPDTGRYHARADLEQIEVPDSVNRVIMSRIDRLDESSRNVLRVASVIGQQFEHWLLSAIYPYRQMEGELQERLTELSGRDILSRAYPDLVYLFSHILTREVAYESLLYADRRRLHRRIGESIERQRAAQVAEYWEVLAYHFGLAEVWNKALDYHLQAGQRAQAIYANEEAIHHLRQALSAGEQVPDDADRQLTAHERLSEVLDTIGDYDAALDHNYRAQDLVATLDMDPEQRSRRMADLCYKTAFIYERKSDYDAAFRWLDAGLVTVHGTQTVERARIYLLGSGIYNRQGKNEEAIAWCQTSLSVSSRIQTREGRQALARAYYNMGLIYFRLGDLARAIEFCRESLSVYEQIEDIVGQSQAHNNLANAYMDRAEQGDWSLGTNHYLQALEIKRKIGELYGQAVITLNLGQAYLDQGDADRASDYYRQSLGMWEELGASYPIALLHNNMGSVALKRQDPEEAISLLKRSLELFQQIGSTDYLSEVHRHLAEAHLDREDLDEALICAQRSLSLAQEGEMRLEEGSTRRVLGQVHLARSDLGRAEQELQTSLHILEELNSRHQIGQTLLQLGLLHRRQERHAQADAALADAIAIFQALGANLDLAQARSALSPPPPLS